MMNKRFLIFIQVVVDLLAVFFLGFGAYLFYSIANLDDTFAQYMYIFVGTLCEAAGMTIFGVLAWATANLAD